MPRRGAKFGIGAGENFHLASKAALPIRRPLVRWRIERPTNSLPVLSPIETPSAIAIPAVHQTVRKPFTRCAKRIKALKTWLKRSQAWRAYSTGGAVIAGSMADLRPRCGASSGPGCHPRMVVPNAGNRVGKLARGGLINIRWPLRMSLIRSGFPSCRERKLWYI